ncbi:MAG: hypothetical protein HYW07_07185 [Candidatus Latescibacteria bacterium]|nr:hypothetical protein [Candidatus Latescibacterota bacterium]
MSTAVTPLSNALDSLERVAGDLEAEGPLKLKGALAWGWHAVGLLAYVRLQPQRQLFDAWVQDYLHQGEPALQLERDARWEERERLSFLELLDLLSAEQLSILKPEFYQGWQDRTSRCQGLRRQMAQIVGGSVNEGQRTQLLVLLAAYHRLIRLPAGVVLDLPSTRRTFPALLDLAALLVDRSTPEAGALLGALERCRKALAA